MIKRLMTLICTSVLLMGVVSFAGCDMEISAQAAQVPKYHVTAYGWGYGAYGKSLKITVSDLSELIPTDPTAASRNLWQITVGNGCVYLVHPANVIIEYY